MFSLSDFHHLPMLDLYFQRILHSRAGLILVAGPDGRSGERQPAGAQPPSGAGFLPSGRSLLFSILLNEILQAYPDAQALILTQDKGAFRIPRGLKARTAFALVDESRQDYRELLEQAARRSSGLLVIDTLQPDNLLPVLQAAGQGIHILAQLDTVLSGAAVAQQLVDWGAAPEQMGGLAWVLSVQRLPALCPHCKTAAPPADLQRHRLRRCLPHLAVENAAESDPDPAFGEPDFLKAMYYQAPGCIHCHQSGRFGDIAAFDVFAGGQGAPPLLERDSLLPVQEYLLHLAVLGRISLADVLDFPAAQLRRTYYRMAASERASAESQAAMLRKLAELEAANRVTTQRTGMLVSLHDISQTLIHSNDLDDLARRVCRHACEVCGADHAILYYLRTSQQAEVLAVSGYSPGLLHQPVPPALILGAGTQPSIYTQRPPGLPPLPGGQRPEPVRSGLLIPLLAQDSGQQAGPLGALLIQSTRKARFMPGEVATLQTLAGQAALAIQRAGLVSELKQKIEQLEAAQVELVKKERLERELELAHQVQQSLLPQAFPHISGYTFVGRCEPARQVGGDFYDVFQIDEDHFGLAIADVSDKGISAALFMGICRSLLLAEARRSHSPAAVLRSINRLLLELANQQMFVTIFYGVVDCRTRSMTYTRAGHERPLLLRRGQALPLEGNGTLLGVFDQVPLEDAQLALQPGDRLVLYTDGLMDVMSPADQRFELSRLTALLEGQSGQPAEGLCAAIFAHLAEYQGQAEQFDDMTMLVVEVS